MFIAGCGASPPPKPKFELPADAVRLEPLPADPDAPEEYTTTESGLKYRILRKSDGKKPTMANAVRMHYRGRRQDGSIFSSTYGKFGAAEYIKLADVIKGSAEGLQLIGEGGMIELIIPPELAYADKGSVAVPPNETLHFIVEMMNVYDVPAQPAKDPKTSEESASDEEKKE
jgi:FKBP-type peptidyl-prolyl cis-trans isomerase